MKKAYINTCTICTTITHVILPASYDFILTEKDHYSLASAVLLLHLQYGVLLALPYWRYHWSWYLASKNAFSYNETIFYKLIYQHWLINNHCLIFGQVIAQCYVLSRMKEYNYIWSWVKGLLSRKYSFMIKLLLPKNEFVFFYQNCLKVKTYQYCLVRQLKTHILAGRKLIYIGNW